MSEPDAVNLSVIAAANVLRHMDPGPLAELRRMTTELGAPAFWRLAAQHPDTIGRDTEAWAAIITILAILTPKGSPENRPALHDAKRPFGAVLCDGGDPAWSGDRPVFSERRLAQLLAARGPARTVALVRAARVLARTRPATSGLDVRGIAWAVLNPNNASQIAEH